MGEEDTPPGMEDTPPGALDLLLMNDLASSLHKLQQACTACLLSPGGECSQREGKGGQQCGAGGRRTKREFLC